MTSLLVAGVLISIAQSPPADSLQRTIVVGLLGAALDSQLSRLAEYGFSGTVLVARDGRVVLLKGYGWADVQGEIPNTAATRFEMNSMTKMFTGAAVLQLEASGRLRVTDRLERYFGPFPDDKRAATIEHLASHTAGLVVAGATLAGESRDAFVRDMIRTPREAAPGTQYRYTNAGFSLLAALVEVVSGLPYEEYLRLRLFEPAGMSTALFRDEVPGDDARFARGYVGTPAGLRRGPPNPYPWGTRGAGGVWSTVGDIFRWILAIESGAVLGEAQRRRLFAPYLPPALEAYGWHVDSAPDGRARVHKGGGSDDFASHMLYYPRDRVIIVWASNNLRQRWRATLNRALPDVIFRGETLRLPAVTPLDEAALQDHAGRYAAGPDMLDVRAGDGYVYVTANAVGVPTNVMFFPTGGREFTGFDPPTGTLTRLRFGSDSAMTVELADGTQIVATRL